MYTSHFKILVLFLNATIFLIKNRLKFYKNYIFSVIKINTHNNYLYILNALQTILLIKSLLLLLSTGSYDTQNTLLVHIPIQ